MTVPHKNEALGVMAEGFREQTSEHGPDSEADQAGEQGHKQLSTMRAKLALAGWAVQVLSDGHRETFMVSRWGNFRHLADRHALRCFMRQVGVQP